MPELFKRRGSRKWHADCYYTDAAGQRHRVQRSTGIVDDGTATARRTALAAARAIEAALALGQGRSARRTPLREAYARALEQKRLAGRSEATLAITCEKAVHVLRYFEGRAAESLTDDDALAYATYATRKRAGATVARELRELNLALKAIGARPLRAPELARSAPRERWLRYDERLRLLEKTAPARREHVIVYLQLGLSKSELFRIQPDDVDAERNVVRVRGTKTRARDRWLPMPADVRAIMLARLRSRASMGAPLFEPWHPGNADRALRRAARAAGLGPISFNDLRRTFASALARAGRTALELRPLMGHTSTRMLDAHYARLSGGQEAQAIVDQLEPLLPVLGGCHASATDSTDTEEAEDTAGASAAPETIIKSRSGG